MKQPLDLLETEGNVTMISRIMQYSLAAALMALLLRFLNNRDRKNNEDEISRK